jgi:N-acetylneuraminate synthase
MTDPPLLRCVAATGKPVIMSTGMASEEEIAESVKTLKNAGCDQ